MILTCPNCTTRFLLPVHTLVPDGRRVKCCECDEVWFQLPDPDELAALEAGPAVEDVPEGVRPIPEGSSVPAIHEDDDDTGRAKGGMVGGLLAACAVGALIFGGLSAAQDQLLKAWPASAAYYELVGAHVEAPGYGLVFDKLIARVEDDGHGGEVLKVSGKVLNLTSQDQAVPMIHAEYRDEHNETISHFYIEPPSDHVEGEEVLDFAITNSKVESGAVALHVRLALNVETDIPLDPHAGDHGEGDAHEEGNDTDHHAEEEDHGEGHDMHDTHEPDHHDTAHDDEHGSDHH